MIYYFNCVPVKILYVIFMSGFAAGEITAKILAVLMNLRGSPVFSPDNGIFISEETQ